MGWLWNCFGRKSERFRRTQPESRTPPRNNDKSGIQAPSGNLHSLGAQIRAPHEASVYEEPFQPKQLVSGAAHGSKLFKRKSVRRAKSCGSSTAFENGAKRLFDKYAVGHIDRLQEEVEGLKKRLAQEEEEAQKLRHEVSYLRSCGVLQSPDRHRNSGNIEKDSLASKEEKGQNWQSWLGLTLSPASRFKLEEQLRCLAADEMSKVPGKGLTNGQKALIVATKLWRNQGDPQQDSQNNTVMNSNSLSFGDVSSSENLRENQLVHAEGADTSEVLIKSDFDQQLTSANEDASFREHLQFGNFSNTSEGSESGSPVSVSSEIENFSFHPSVSGDTVNAKGIPVLQRTPSCPESMMASLPVKETGGKASGPVVEKFESPKTFRATPTTGGSGSQNSDPDHVQARRFIDLRYQELEEKLLKSPKSESVAFKQGLEINSQGENKGHLQDDEVEVSVVLDDINRTEPQDFNSSGGYNGSPSLTTKPYFVCKSGRSWQPLSPVREVDSGRSSKEEGVVTNASQFNVSDSADSSNASDLKSSLRTIISASKWEQGDASRHHSISSEVHDDDLFTLSPRRLHHSYNPWDHPHKSDDEVDDEQRVDLSQNSRSGAGWASSGEVDDDLAPIQCQSPSFSPRQKFKKSKFVEGRALKVDEYARDKYFKEMGFNLDEFLFSSDSCISMDSAAFEKENQDEGNIEAVMGLEMESAGVGRGDIDGIDTLSVKGKQLFMAGAPLEAAMSLKKSIVQDDVTLSQDFEHPVLSSIENLPKVVEYQGVSSAHIEYQDNHITGDVLEEKGSTKDKPPVHFSPEKRDRVIRSLVERRQIVGHEEEPMVGSGNRNPDNSAAPSESSVRQVDTVPSPISRNADGHNDNSLRLKLPGCAHEDGDQLQFRLPSPKDNEVQSQQPQQRETDAAMGEVFNGGRWGELHNCSTEVDVNDQESLFTVQSKDLRDVRDENSMDGQSGHISSSHSHGETMSECQSEGLRQEAEKKVVRLDNDVKNDVLTHTQSLGYSIQIPKFKEAFSDTENAFESSSVGGDSELSRDGDETFHDCESPTLSENIPESAESSFSLSETPSQHYFGSSKPRILQDELNLSKRTLDISPDDRPILGTVATHWGDGSDPKSQREWDGLGIPNSTSKFKEDQRVSWHSTPFETRLEQALAKLPIVPELHNQRRLFEGVAMM